MRRTTSLALAFGGSWALGLLACGGVPAPAAPAMNAAVPVTSGAPTATPAANATAATAATAATPTSPFHIVGELEAELSLHGAGERGFLISQSGIELQLVGDEVIQDPLLKRGLDLSRGMITVDAVGGRYPDAFWLATTQPMNRSGFSTLWRWDGKNWQKKQTMNENHFVNGIRPWLGGRLLALEQAGMEFNASFLVLSGDKRVAVPQLTKSKTMELFSFCTTQVRADLWMTLPTGEVIALGQHCDSEHEYQELAVERWASGSTSSSIDIMPAIHAPGDLPSVSYTTTGLAAPSANDIYVAATKVQWVQGEAHNKESPYLAHFDGKSWQTPPSPIAGNVRSLWSEPGGVVFASNEKDELWSRGADRKWSRIVWPAQVSEDNAVRITGLWSRSAGDTWVVVEATNPRKGVHFYLLHTRPATNAIPPLEVRELKDRSLQMPGPPVEWCSTRFVLLYTLGRNAPADYDYPATRQALKGHSELGGPDTEFVEFEREGRRYFGARVGDFKLGKKLAQLVKDKVPGSTPELVCLDPIEKRKLDIDLKTGELRK